MQTTKNMTQEKFIFSNTIKMMSFAFFDSIYIKNYGKDK